MKILLLTTLLFTACIASSQSIARFTISEKNPIPTPRFVNLDQITNLSSSQLELYNVKGNTRTKVAIQTEDSYHRFLWWLAVPEHSSVYELVQTNGKKATETVHITTAEKSITISSGKNNFLQYNFGTHYPPDGVDSAFKRSGFIHPLWSPSGKVLTRINPSDHYHHMGLWNPWTHVLFQGKDVDFWNLKDKKGTVRFSNFAGIETGEVFAGFKALQEHVAFNIPEAGMETTALHETWDVRVFRLTDKIWLCDFVSVLNCATDSVVTLKEYRYGGFGFRATEEWTNKNSRVLTSEGKTRKDADATAARWCLVEGNDQGATSGILFLSAPSNFNHPEPMRVWPEDANNKRGDVFFSFSPTRNKDWVLTPGKNHVLKYRMLVYEGEMDATMAESAWQQFAHTPHTTIEKL